jgi:hypothetical protein
MSERKISVSLTFDFYPDGEHEDLFEEMTEDEIVKNAMRMTTDDIQSLSDSGDVYRMLSVEVTSE